MYIIAAGVSSWCQFQHPPRIPCSSLFKIPYTSQTSAFGPEPSSMIGWIRGCKLSRETCETKTSKRNKSWLCFRAGALFLSHFLTSEWAEVLSGLTEEGEAHLAEQVLCRPFFSNKVPPFPLPAPGDVPAPASESKVRFVEVVGCFLMSSLVSVFTVDPATFIWFYSVITLMTSLN